MIHFSELRVMILNAAPGMSARTLFLALFLAAMHGLVPVDPSLIPRPRTSSDADNVYLGQVRRRSDRNTLSSAPLLRKGFLLPRHPAPSLQLSLEAAETAGDSLFPPETAPGSRDRKTGRRRRRSKALDSSDPLCLHTQRGMCSLTQPEGELPPQPEADPPEHSHAVSKETIASTSDDPLNVVQPPEGAGSPRSVGTDKALTKKRTAAEEEPQA